MKIKNAKLMDNNMFQTLFNLFRTETMTGTASYKVKMICNAIDKKKAELMEKTKALTESFTEKDAEGNPIPVYSGEGEDKKIVGVKLTNEEEANKLYQELMAEEFELELKPLYAIELSSVKISAMGLDSIEPFIADPDNF